MASDKISKYGFQKLGDGIAWTVWRARVKGRIAEKGWTAALADAESEFSEQARGVLLNAVGDQYLSLVEDADSAAAAWDALVALYEQDSTANYATLLKQFSNLKMGQREDIVSYMARSKNLAAQLSAAGDEVQDRRLVVQILSGLPATFHVISTLIQNTDPLPNLAVLQAKLVTEEKQMERNLKPSAIDGMARQLAFMATEDRQRCYYCGGVGHIAKDCPNKKRDQQREANLRARYCRASTSEGIAF